MLALTAPQHRLRTQVIITIIFAAILLSVQLYSRNRGRGDGGEVMVNSIQEFAPTHLRPVPSAVPDMAAHNAALIMSYGFGLSMPDVPVAVPPHGDDDYKFDVVVVAIFKHEARWVVPLSVVAVVAVRGVSSLELACCMGQYLRTLAVKHVCGSTGIDDYEHIIRTSPCGMRVSWWSSKLPQRVRPAYH